MIVETHTLLVSGHFVAGELKRIDELRYFKSKFPRELGEKLEMDGETYYVGAIADTKEEVEAFGIDLAKKIKKLKR